MERVDYESMVVQELLNAHERDELNVSPWYQRRAVWSNAHKSYLVNTVFEIRPVPTLYIRHTIDIEREKTIKEVVDGQQRCRSIIEYRENGFSARHPEHPRRVFFSDLTPRQKEQFLMAKLPVAYLIGANDADVIEIFGRLNAVSKTLNAQEKRSAKWSGEFHQFCLREAVSRLPLWRGLGVFTATEISRMAEVQFTAELAMALASGMEDFSAARVDKAYRTWDEDFPLSATTSRVVLSMCTQQSHPWILGQSGTPSSVVHLCSTRSYSYSMISPRSPQAHNSLRRLRTLTRGSTTRDRLPSDPKPTSTLLLRARRVPSESGRGRRGSTTFIHVASCQHLA